MIEACFVESDFILFNVSSNISFLFFSYFCLSNTYNIDLIGILNDIDISKINLEEALEVLTNLEN